jgi:hypothetical protein
MIAISVAESDRAQEQRDGRSDACDGQLPKRGPS